MTGIRKGAVPELVLSWLAENGPQERTHLKDYLEGLEVEDKMLLTRLHDSGYIKTKVWLTPDGLAELKRLGWKPAQETYSRG